MSDYYQILGIPRKASEGQIKEAFRRLAVKLHPDKTPGKVHLFREVSEAYEVLHDPLKRQAYDLSITLPDKPPPLRRHGTDLVVKLKVQASDIANGLPKTISTTRLGICSHCNGTGSSLKVDTECLRCSGLGYDPISGIVGPKQMCKSCNGYGKIPQGSVCSQCRGSGLVSEQVSTEIRILPQGTGRILIPDLGNACPHGGYYGDLFVEVMVERDPLYEIDGLKIKCRIYLTPAQAALGEDIPLDVFGRQLILKVPPGTQPGNIIEIEKGGLELGRRHGNFEARIWVVIPNDLNDQQRNLYQQLRLIEKGNLWQKM